MGSVGQDLPWRVKERRRLATLPVSEKCLRPGLGPDRSCLKTACTDPQPLPLLRAGHCYLGDLAVHSHPGREKGNWSSPDLYLAPPTPSEPQRPSDACSQADRWAKPCRSLPGTSGLRRLGCWDRISAKGQVACPLELGCHICLGSGFEES